MRKKWICQFFTATLLVTQGKLAAEPEPVVQVELQGQLGNLLFQVATASAVAWDNGAVACFPNLGLVPKFLHHIFSRFDTRVVEGKEEAQWREEAPFRYKKIAYLPNMKLFGYFQNEKYFVHHKERLLALLAPIPQDLAYMQKKYSFILNGENTVGVQLRHYFEDPSGSLFIQYGKDYLEKATSQFPPESLFIVSSNNKEFVKENFPKHLKNVYFLNDKDYIELYLLSFCKHNIISNSTFGWWSAWLNTHPNKIVICPEKWVRCEMTDEICPKSWVRVKGKEGCFNDQSSY